MAKIDDSLKKKVPELRFKGFTDDWEQRKFFESIASTIDFRGRTPKKLGMDWSDSGYLALSALNVKNGYIDPLADAHYGDEKLYRKWMSGRELKKGQVLFTTEAPMGNVAQVPDDNGYILSQRTVAFETKEDMMTNDFLAVLLKSPLVFNNLSALSSGGTAKGVSQKSLKGLSITVPLDIDEQQKIGSFFKQLDNTITLHQRKLDLLKEQKKGYLQKMFPKNGAKVPELRFAGFADDWEERKLSSMTNYKNGKSHEDKQSTSGKLELINLNSISISGGLKHSGKFIDEADDTLQKDDLVMILSDVGHGDLLGRVALIPEDDRFVLNQRVALLRPNTTADPQFLFSYINAHQYYFKAQGAGMSQLNISKGSVENFISFVPIIEEQKKIGAFYKRLDDTIALHQRKLDLLKEQKKGFLQKMFV
ncbi:restriction endonuclease subunit S [Lactococcus laudensis]|uniref:restriction endonuclease subunit S n=2 Tax=Pseudolactococcus laudensis TaxID=1494461 RepID=UPI002FC650A4